MLLLSLIFQITLITIISPTNIFANSNVKINEFLAHPSSGNKEWVEFYNPDNTDLSSYWLDDDTDFGSDSGTSPKKSLSGYNNANTTYPHLEFSSFLNNSGDYVVLFDPNGTIVDEYQYTDDPGADVSHGRAPDGTGAFFKLDSSSKGAPNGSPIASPTPSTTPSPSPMATSTSSKSTSTAKSPSPTPKSSPSTIASPKASADRISATILGQKSESTGQSSSTQASSPSPSATPQAQKSNQTKLASYLMGSGLALIGLSTGLFLWFKRRPESDEKTDG